MGNYGALVISFFCAGILAWIVAKYGQRFKLVDYPSARSSHIQPVPKGGGSGIVFGFLMAALLLGVNILWWLPALIIGLLGLVADRTEIAPRIRLFFQFILALLFLLNFITRPVSFTPAALLVLWFSVYIVGTANIYNFMDGINGIAAISGAVGFFFLGCFALTSGADAALPPLLFAVAVACLGFLPFNYPKAKVFMGDVGSTFLGFFFACMVTYLARDAGDFVVLLSFLFPFYGDELTTMFVRIKDRENLTQAHRRHLYQILVNEGQIAHWQVSLAYGAGQLVIALAALWLQRFGTIPLVIMLAVFLGGFAALSTLVRKKLCHSIPTPPI